MSAVQGVQAFAICTNFHPVFNNSRFIEIPFPISIDYFDPNEFTIIEQIEKAYEALFNMPLFDELKQEKLKLLLKYVFRNIEIYNNTSYLTGIPILTGEETEEQKQTFKQKLILLLKYISLYMRKTNLKTVIYLSLLGFNQKLINILNNNGELSANDWHEIWYLRNKYLAEFLKKINFNEKLYEKFILIYNTIFKDYIKYKKYNLAILYKNECLAEMLFNVRYIPENLTAIYYKINNFIKSDLYDIITRFLNKAESTIDLEVFKMRVADYYLANFPRHEIENKLELIEKAKTKKDLLKILFDFNEINEIFYKFTLINNTIKNIYYKQINITKTFNPCPMSYKNLKENLEKCLKLLNKLLNYEN